MFSISFIDLRQSPSGGPYYTAWLNNYMLVALCPPFRNKEITSSKTHTTSDIHLAIGLAMARLTDIYHICRQAFSIVALILKWTFRNYNPCSSVVDQSGTSILLNIDTLFRRWDVAFNWNATDEKWVTHSWVFTGGQQMHVYTFRIIDYSEEAGWCIEA